MQSQSELFPTQVHFGLRRVDSSCFEFLGLVLFSEVINLRKCIYFYIIYCFSFFRRVNNIPYILCIDKSGTKSDLGN